MNPLQFDPNDSRFTAYLLNEASDIDRAAVEAILEHSADARKFVDEQRAAIFELESALACEVEREPTPTLELAPTEDVEPARSTEVPAKRLSFRTRLRVAAACLICVGTAGLIWNDMQRQGERADALASSEVVEVGSASVGIDRWKELRAEVYRLSNLEGDNLTQRVQVLNGSTPEVTAESPRSGVFHVESRGGMLEEQTKKPFKRVLGEYSRKNPRLAPDINQASKPWTPVVPLSAQPRPEALVTESTDHAEVDSDLDKLGPKIEDSLDSSVLQFEYPSIANAQLRQADARKQANKRLTKGARGLAPLHGKVERMQSGASGTADSTSPVHLNPSAFGTGVDGFDESRSEDWSSGWAYDAARYDWDGINDSLRGMTEELEKETVHLRSKSPLWHAVGPKLEDLDRWTEVVRPSLPIYENPFLSPDKAPLSTFSIDVDTGAYANVRRYINAGQCPPIKAVRIEELVNNFHYQDAEPKGEHPIAVTLEAAPCPWQTQHKLVRIGLKAKTISESERPLSNLVFLIDVSGSMQDRNKLPLLKEGMKVLVEKLTENDRVAIVTYSGSSGLLLPSTSGENKAAILSAIEGLRAKGSTNGGAGIQLAYEQAVKHFIPEGSNRVILATDGDFNMGITDRAALEQLIKDKAKTGVYLSVLGFGTGNLKDVQMEQIANKGNGIYSYIDQIAEAEKVLGRELLGTLITVAKDVKLQVEFNPSHVEAYRLIGYENRTLKAQDFNNDQKDAGEVGAGHSVMALYQVVPVGVAVAEATIDNLRYKAPAPKAEAKLANVSEHSDEWLNVKVRYKQPAGKESTRFDVPLKDAAVQSTLENASEDLRWSSAVAAFGLMLRGSAFRGQMTFAGVFEIAGGAVGDDEHKDRAGFLKLVQKVVSATSR